MGRDNEHNTSKLFLGIETSTPVCSVALFDENSIIREIRSSEGRSHSSKLTVLIEELMQEQNVEWQGLTGVVFSDGPGSYTGLRIGASVAKGLCYVHDLELRSICGLEAAARRSWKENDRKGIHVGCSDARREDVYICIIGETGEVIQSPEMWTLEDQWSRFLQTHFEEQIFISGEGKQKILSWNKENWISDSVFGHSAENLFASLDLPLENQVVTNKMRFEPFYMQSPNITQSKKLTLRK